MAETIAGLVAMLVGLVVLAMAVWAMLLARAVRDAVDKRQIKRADKLLVWMQRADAVLMVGVLIMFGAGMVVVISRL